VKCKVAMLTKVRLQMRRTCRRVRHWYQPDVRVPRPAGSMDLRAKNKGPRMRQSGADGGGREGKRAKNGSRSAMVITELRTVVGDP